MANLFEKPIAANPLSQFAELPLQFIDRAMQRRQQSHDLARAEIEEQEDSLLNLRYLPGDAQRHHEIQGKYDKELDAIVESADGDYSRVQASLDRFSRRLRAEMAHGELGAQHNAFNAAAARREAEDKRLADGKSSQEGFNMFLESINAHKTLANEDGTFTTFTGYTPSNIVDPYKELQDSADEIEMKYDAQGRKYVDRRLIENNVYTKLATNSNIEKALREKFGITPNDPNYSEKYQQYRKTIINSVVTDKERQEILKPSESGSGGGGGFGIATTMFDVGVPRTAQGETKYVGGSNSGLKAIAESIGLDSFKEHKDSINTPEVQHDIDFINAGLSPEERFPETGSSKEQSDWILRHATQPQTSEVILRPATSDEARILDKEGRVISDGAVYDREGSLVKSKRLFDKSEDNVKSTIVGVIEEGGAYGHPPGTVVIMNAAGDKYFIEQTSKDVVRSPSFNESLITSAANTKTGRKTVTLQGTAFGKIPKGTYEVEVHPDRTQMIIKQNGIPVYVRHVKDGQLVTDKLK